MQLLDLGQRIWFGWLIIEILLQGHGGTETC